MANAERIRFRPFKVTAKIRESETITSFHLKPTNPSYWTPFEAGQFLTIRVPDKNSDGFVLRNYTVSSSPEDVGFYRITVKREGALQPDHADGLSSCWLHDCIEEGALVEIDGPRGAFKLDRSTQRPVVLLSGGVGLTPMVSMLRQLSADKNRRVSFIHACDHGGVHALRREVAELIAANDMMQVHYCYRFPRIEDKANGHFHSEGVLTKAGLQALLPLDDYDFYLCGPRPFMQAIYDYLREMGVSDQRIAYEFFGPASLLKAGGHVTEHAQVAPVQKMAGSGEHKIHLQRSQRDLIWDNDAVSLLDFLEANGIEPEFSCRAGICGSCEKRLISGEVCYFEEPLDEPAHDKVLLCCARPSSSIVLDL